MGHPALSVIFDEKASKYEVDYTSLLLEVMRYQTMQCIVSYPAVPAAIGTFQTRVMSDVSP
jgi:hypothetical protein